MGTLWCVSAFFVGLSGEDCSDSLVLASSWSSALSIVINRCRITGSVRNFIHVASSMKLSSYITWSCVHNWSVRIRKWLQWPLMWIKWLCCAALDKIWCPFGHFHQREDLKIVRSNTSNDWFWDKAVWHYSRADLKENWLIKVSGSHF